MSMSCSAAEQFVEQAIRECSLAGMHEEEFLYDPEAHADTEFSELGFDSLNTMEFCIALHCACGVELSITDLTHLRTPRAVSEWLAGAK